MENSKSRPKAFSRFLGFGGGQRKSVDLSAAHPEPQVTATPPEATPPQATAIPSQTTTELPQATTTTTPHGDAEKSAGDTAKTDSQEDYENEQREKLLNDHWSRQEINDVIEAQANILKCVHAITAVVDLYAHGTAELSRAMRTYADVIDRRHERVFSRAEDKDDLLMEAPGQNNKPHASRKNGDQNPRPGIADDKLRRKCLLKAAEFWNRFSRTHRDYMGSLFKEYATVNEQAQTFFDAYSVDSLTLKEFLEHYETRSGSFDENWHSKLPSLRRKSLTGCSGHRHFKKKHIDLDNDTSENTNLKKKCPFNPEENWPHYSIHLPAPATYSNPISLLEMMKLEVDVAPPASKAPSTKFKALRKICVLKEARKHTIFCRQIESEMVNSVVNELTMKGWDSINDTLVKTGRWDAIGGLRHCAMWLDLASSGMPESPTTSTTPSTPPRTAAEFMMRSKTSVQGREGEEAKQGGEKQKTVNRNSSRVRSNSCVKEDHSLDIYRAFHDVLTTSTVIGSTTEQSLSVEEAAERRREVAAWKFSHLAGGDLGMKSGERVPMNYHKMRMEGADSNATASSARDVYNPSRLNLPKNRDGPAKKPLFSTVGEDNGKKQSEDESSTDSQEWYDKSSSSGDDDDFKGNGQGGAAPGGSSSQNRAPDRSPGNNTTYSSSGSRRSKSEGHGFTSHSKNSVPTVSEGQLARPSELMPVINVSNGDPSMDQNSSSIEAAISSIKTLSTKPTSLGNHLGIPKTRSRLPRSSSAAMKSHMKTGDSAPSIEASLSASSSKSHSLATTTMSNAGSFRSLTDPFQDSAQSEVTCVDFPPTPQNTIHRHAVFSLMKANTSEKVKSSIIRDTDLIPGYVPYGMKRSGKFWRRPTGEFDVDLPGKGGRVVVAAFSDDEESDKKPTTVPGHARSNSCQQPRAASHNIEVVQAPPTLRNRSFSQGNISSVSGNSQNRISGTPQYPRRLHSDKNAFVTPVRGGQMFSDRNLYFDSIFGGPAVGGRGGSAAAVHNE